jgi:signal transduction histidine kinase
MSVPARLRHRKQTLLFLLVVLLPSTALTGLALHLLEQERQWERREWEESRRRAAAELGRSLGLELERIRLEEQGRLQASEAGASGARHPALVLAARQRDGRLILPWEEGPRTPPAPAFLRRLGEGARAEFGGNAAGAAAAYRHAAELAPDEGSEAAARLALARVLGAGGDLAEAARTHASLLALPSHVTDEHGVPYALYAADALRSNLDQREAVVRRLEEDARLPPPLAPLHAYLLRDLSAELGVMGGSADHVWVVEQLLALKRDLPALVRLAGSPATPSAADGAPRDPPWIPYGDPLWLVSAAPALDGGDTLVLAISAEAVLWRAAAGTGFPSEGIGRARLHRDPAAGDPLGPAFPGLRASLPALQDPPPGMGGRARFLLLVLPLMLAVTLFSGWLLWRDVRREVHAAALRSRFVSSVSHELKTPLTSIRMFAEMLAMGHAQDPERRDAYLELIVAESGRLTRLINNVLDFARIDEGRRGYRKEPVRLDDVVREAARTMAYPVAQREVALRIDADAALPPVSADRDALLQAILNLLSNAVKFSGPGGEVDLRLLRRNGEAWIEVEDRGMGIEPADRERIFEEFYRSPAADREGIAGAGLGLPLVAHVARGHGGSVDVRSEPGQGSTFTLRLPLEPPP